MTTVPHGPDGYLDSPAAERYDLAVNGTILIVDDDDDTAVLLRDSLRKRGFDVDSVNSAQQCLEHLRTDPADVVVTDVQMTGMSNSPFGTCGPPAVGNRVVART